MEEETAEIKHRTCNAQKKTKFVDERPSREVEARKRTAQHLSIHSAVVSFEIACTDRHRATEKIQLRGRADGTRLRRGIGVTTYGSGAHP